MVENGVLTEIGTSGGGDPFVHSIQNAVAGQSLNYNGSNWVNGGVQDDNFVISQEQLTEAFRDPVDNGPFFMANSIRIKRRATGGGAGAPASLLNAELAFNEDDSKLYIGVGDNGSGVATSILTASGPGII